MKNYIIVSVFAFLAGCSTGYKPHGIGGGYEDVELSPGYFRVSVRGNGVTSAEKVNDLALLRASDLIIAKGCPSFKVVSSKNSTKPSSKPAKTTAKDREALNKAIVMYVAKTGSVNYSEAYTMIHHRFKVEHTHELTHKQLDEAILYIHSLLQVNGVIVDQNYHASAQSLAIHMLWLNRWWREFGDAIRVISPRMAGAVHDRFIDGACFAFKFIDKDERDKISEDAKYYPWHMSFAERSALEYHKK